MKKNILSLIGGLIGTVPFILIYIFGNYTFSILTFIIPYLVYYFYKLDKKELEKKDYINIFINSIISISIALFIIIPIFIMIKNNYEISLQSFISLYNINGFIFNVIKGSQIVYIFILFASFFIYKGKDSITKKELIILSSITLIFSILSIFIKIDKNSISNFNLKYKKQEVKINKDLNIYIPNYFYKYNDNEYRLHDMKSGSSNYANSLVKSINIKYLKDYQYYSYNEIKQLETDEKNISKITDLGSNLLIEGKEFDKHYFDYYIKDNKDTIYIHFLTKDNSKLTKNTVNKIVESIS